MELKEELSGVPGMLRPFKAYLRGAGLGAGDQVVYYGCPGTCTPFIELLGFAVRDLPVEQVYVPYAKIVGVCFMQMFEKAGWLDAFDFDLIIDAALDPVRVWG